MAGILANSATQTMLDGDTAVDKVVTGYLLGEQITLGVTGSPTSLEWGQAVPSGSAPARSVLSSTTSAAPRFTPDVAGYYVITCNADGAPYVIRISVLAVAASVAREAILLMPVDASQIQAPAAGIVLFCDGDDLKFKDSSGTVSTVTTS